MDNSNTRFPNLPDGLGDWRIRAATRVAKDVPAAFPGGPSHKAGAPVYLVSAATLPSGQKLSFVTPDATALALSIAVTSARHAQSIRESFHVKKVLTPEGPGETLEPGDSGELFEFFESCMVVVSFSFQAIESFSNWQISKSIGDGTFAWPTNKKSNETLLSAEELERVASTEDKVGTILPALLGRPSPKGTRVWESFIKLKRLRDDTQHLKSKDQYPKGDDAGDSLMFSLLGQDLMMLPANAAEFLKHFVKDDEMPRWVEGVEAALGNRD